MSQLASHQTDLTVSRGGGRVASARYRQSLQQCEDFAGLEENTNRYDLLLLVKKVGKAAGFSPRAIQLLDYYMAYTRDIDWEEGSRPIVYQSLSRTALDMGVSERQIQKLEQQLFSLGAISWNDSGNHKRYGQRDARTGRILFAYGVDLSPLAYLRSELEAKLHEKQLYDQAWLETKRQISWYRGQIRGLLREAEEGASPCPEFVRRYGEIDVQLRTHLDLAALRTLLERHRSLHSDMVERVGEEGGETPDAPHEASMAEETGFCSPRSAPKFAHYQSTTQQSFDKSNRSSTSKSLQEDVVRSPERQTGAAKNVRLPKREGQPQHTPANLMLAAGLQHISLKHALHAASGRLREYLPMASRPRRWADMVEAAYQLCPQLGISQASWGDACELLGRTGAAICVLLTDRAAQRAVNPARRPAAYFSGMVKRARVGELRLHRSIFGLLDVASAAHVS